MGISTEAIRLITIEARSRGIPETIKAVDGLTASQQNLATVADTSAKRQLSAAQQYERQTLSVVAGAREQANYEKAVRTAKSAMDQGVISSTQYAARVDLLKEKYGQGSAGAKAFAAATSGLSGQMIAMSAGAGPVGVFLSALGPWGMAAAAGVSLLGIAFAETRRTAELLAKEADVLQNNSEITGWSTAQLQALTMEAAKHGVSVEQATTAIVKFSAAWGEARDGGGDMLTQLRKIDPALATQMQRTKDSAAALDLLVQAMRKADAAGDTSARIQLARAAGGRGGVSAFTGISAAIGEAGSFAALTQNARDAGKVISDQLLKEVDNLKDELDETRKRADLLMGAIGAKPVLEADLAWQKMRLQIFQTSQALADAEKSKGFWEWFFEKAGGGDHMAATLKTIDKRGAGLNQPALNQMPEYPPTTYGLEGPSQAEKITTAGQLKNMREQISLLGSAATATERYSLRILELKAAVEANGTAVNIEAAARATSMAGMELHSQMLQANTGTLGSAAIKRRIICANDNENEHSNTSSPRLKIEKKVRNDSNKHRASAAA